MNKDYISVRACARVCMPVCVSVCVCVRVHVHVCVCVHCLPGLIYTVGIVLVDRETNTIPTV